MSLPVFRRFSIQDIPDAPDWIERITNPLNLFCETTVNCFTQNLIIGQNVQGQKYTTTFTTPGDYITGGFNVFNFAYTGGGQPNCLLIGNISRTDGVKIIKPVSITDWSLNINVTPYRATIGYIAGLEANTKYNVTLLAL